MEDDIDELPHSDFSKAADKLFDEIDHGKAVNNSGVQPDYISQK